MAPGAAAERVAQAIHAAPLPHDVHELVDGQQRVRRPHVHQHAVVALPVVLRHRLQRRLGDDAAVENQRQDAQPHRLAVHVQLDLVAVAGAVLQADRGRLPGSGSAAVQHGGEPRGDLGEQARAQALLRLLPLPAAHLVVVLHHGHLVHRDVGTVRCDGVGVGGLDDRVGQHVREAAVAALAQVLAALAHDVVAAAGLGDDDAAARALQPLAAGDHLAQVLVHGADGGLVGGLRTPRAPVLLLAHQLAAQRHHALAVVVAARRGAVVGHQLLAVAAHLVVARREAHELRALVEHDVLARVAPRHGAALEHAEGAAVGQLQRRAVLQHLPPQLLREHRRAEVGLGAGAAPTPAPQGPRTVGRRQHAHRLAAAGAQGRRRERLYQLRPRRVVLRRRHGDGGQPRHRRRRGGQRRARGAGGGACLAGRSSRGGRSGDHALHLRAVRVVDEQAVHAPGHHDGQRRQVRGAVIQSAAGPRHEHRAACASTASAATVVAVVAIVVAPGAAATACAAHGARVLARVLRRQHESRLLRPSPRVRAVRACARRVAQHQRLQAPHGHGHRRRRRTGRCGVSARQAHRRTPRRADGQQHLGLLAAGVKCGGALVQAAARARGAQLARRRERAHAGHVYEVVGVRAGDAGETHGTIGEGLVTGIFPKQ